MSEAADLTWGDVQRIRGGSGRVRVVGAGETDYREVSADKMKLLLPVRQGVSDEEPVLGIRPNQIATRIATAARQAGLGDGDSGDIKHMETLGVHLLGATPPRPHDSYRPSRQRAGARRARMLGTGKNPHGASCLRIYRILTVNGKSYHPSIRLNRYTTYRRD